VSLVSPVGLVIFMFVAAQGRPRGAAAMPGPPPPRFSFDSAALTGRSYTPGPPTCQMADPWMTTRIDALDTPFAAIDLDIVERNLARAQRYFDEHKLALRPHIKTHKIPELARRQVELGAGGIACQKIGEAEVMADAGIADILLTFNIVGPLKLRRL